jgi:aldose 1-epimerase
MPAPPSGRQFTIVRGGQRATIVEVGGGLRSYVCDGRELLDGFAETEMITNSRGQPLVPWPNRIQDGRYTWEGQEHQLALSEPGRRNAIHGLLRFTGWTCTELTTTSVELACAVHPHAGYPFALAVRVAYALDETGELVVTTTATNVGTAALPYASGQHPYLAPPSGTLDDCTLQLGASTWLPTDERGIPVGAEDVDRTEYDLRAGRPLAGLQLDTAFTGLDRDEQGKAWVVLRGPDGRGTAVWQDQGYPYVQLFTGDGLPLARRRQGLAVEPMSAPANAFRTGTSLTRLEPGESATTRWGIRPLS